MLYAPSSCLRIIADDIRFQHIQRLPDDIDEGAPTEPIFVDAVAGFTEDPHFHHLIHQDGAFRLAHFDKAVDLVVFRHAHYLINREAVPASYRSVRFINVVEQGDTPRDHKVSGIQFQRPAEFVLDAFVQISGIHDRTQLLVLQREGRISIRRAIVLGILPGERLHKDIPKELKNAGVVVGVCQNGLQVRIAVNLEAQVAQRLREKLLRIRWGQRLDTQRRSQLAEDTVGTGGIFRAADVVEACNYKFEVVFSDSKGKDYALIEIYVGDLEVVRSSNLTDEDILEDLPKHDPHWWCKVENGYILNLLGEKKNKIPYDYES